MSRRREGTTESRLHAWWIGILGAAMITGGCGNLTAGGIGEARVVVSGDAPGASAALVEARTPPAHAPGGSSHEEEEDDPEGEVEVEFTLALIADDGAAVPLGSETLQVEVDLQGEFEADALTAQIPASAYTGLRVTFLEIDVQVDRGLVVGGVPVTGFIDVELEGELVVTRDLTLVVEDGGVVELLVDLNAPAWLQAVDPVTKVVDPSVFAALVTVVSRD